MSDPRGLVYFADLGAAAGKAVRVELVGTDEGRPVDEVRLADGEVRRAFVRALATPGRILVGLDDRSVVGFAGRRDGAWHVEIEGRAFVVRVDDERTHRIRALTASAATSAAASELRAPMPGLVVRVGVGAGDEVQRGDGLIVMEAMKMENELRAERDGIVAEVHVAEGATVDRDDLLVTFGAETT